MDVAALARMMEAAERERLGRLATSRAARIQTGVGESGHRIPSASPAVGDVRAAQDLREDAQESQGTVARDVAEQGMRAGDYVFGVLPTALRAANPDGPGVREAVEDYWGRSDDASYQQYLREKGLPEWAAQLGGLGAELVEPGPGEIEMLFLPFRRSVRGLPDAEFVLEEASYNPAGVTGMAETLKELRGKIPDSVISVHALGPREYEVRVLEDGVELSANLHPGGGHINTLTNLDADGTPKIPRSILAFLDAADANQVPIDTFPSAFSHRRMRTEELREMYNQLGFEPLPNDADTFYREPLPVEYNDRKIEARRRIDGYMQGYEKSRKWRTRLSKWAEEQIQSPAVRAQAEWLQGVDPMQAKLLASSMEEALIRLQVGHASPEGFRREVDQIREVFLRHNQTPEDVSRGLSDVIDRLKRGIPERRMDPTKAPQPDPSPQRGAATPPNPEAHARVYGEAESLGSSPPPIVSQAYGRDELERASRAMTSAVDSFARGDLRPDEYLFVVERAVRDLIAPARNVGELPQEVREELVPIVRSLLQYGTQ